jgi:hypothetical protein
MPKVFANLPKMDKNAVFQNLFNYYMDHHNSSGEEVKLRRINVNQHNENGKVQDVHKIAVNPRFSEVKHQDVNISTENKIVEPSDPENLDGDSELKPHSDTNVVFLTIGE